MADSKKSLGAFYAFKFGKRAAESPEGGRTLGRSRRYTLAVLTALLGTLFALATAELAVRMIAKPTTMGAAVRGEVLPPKDWDVLRTHMGKVWDKASGDLSYLEYDPQLGWTLGANRRSANGLYFSSPEGIRAPRIGSSLATSEPKRRVAIMGDSFTFGEEVEYQDTFPARLQESLGQRFQVLNFGVPGYGVDQAYRRYMKDVLDWNPEIVVLAFVSHDLVRTMSVYTFINFPHWDMPFSKPRAVPSTSGGLGWVNVPTVQPVDMFDQAEASDLPFLGLDIGYEADQWRTDLTDSSYLFRFVASRVSHLQPPKKQKYSDAEIFGVNAAIVRNFVKLAKENGSVPIVAYLAGRQDFDPSRKDPNLGRAFLSGSGINHFDSTACLSTVNRSERFTVKNPHYSPVANAAVGWCLGDHIRRVLDERASQAKTHFANRAESGV